MLFIYPQFLSFIEKRSGVVLNDPILNTFSPVDFTWLIFGLIYSSLIITIIHLSFRPALLLTALQAYTLLIVLRIAAMYLVPLNPPVEMIPLKDPLVEFLGNGVVLTKDLFFSGHTATLFLLFLIAKTNFLKKMLLLSTLIIAFSVILQHVHYTIDVLTAPFFAFAVYSAALKIRNYLSPKV